MLRVALAVVTAAVFVCATAWGIRSASAAPSTQAPACDSSGKCVTCDPLTGLCQVTVVQPGTPGTTTSTNGNAGSGGTSSGCSWDASTYPCSDSNLGWFDNDDGCYYRLNDPQPAAGDPSWDGHSPADGAVYTRICEGFKTGLNGVLVPRGNSVVWLADPPPGNPNIPPPAATLAQRALASLQLPTLVASSNGGASATTYVSVATWLWVDAAAWKPVTATAAVGGRSVTLTATPVSTTWSTGDGSAGVQCAGPGAPFDAANPQDPPCGYTYRTSSAAQPQVGSGPNDRYFTVQANVNFGLHWVCVGDCDQPAGDLAGIARPTTPLALKVLEIQTVVVSN